jgi:hypothetical protein
VSERDEKDNPRTRRKHRRVAAREVTAEIEGRSGTITYTVQNISTGGILINGGRAPSNGTIEITLRQSGTRSIQLTGHVVHELPEGIGIAFEPMSSVVAEAVEKLIAAVDERNNLPPPLPTGRPSKEEPPPSAPRPTDNPFASGQDPRPPRLGSPDERSEYLRVLVKRRDEALQRGRTMYEGVLAEAEQLRAAMAKMKLKLDSALGQVTLGESALAYSRRATEEEAAALELERATASEMLEQEQRRTLEAIGTVAGLEAKIRRLETDAASARRDAEAARREVSEVVADTASLRKSREELVAANRKAMEAQSALNKERATRVLAEAPIAEARAAQEAAEAENKKLTAELARLKQKLIAAENALERSAMKKPPTQRT